MKLNFSLSLMLLGALCLVGCHANTPPGDTEAHTGGPSPGPISNSEGAKMQTESAYQLILVGKYKEAEPLLKKAVQYDPLFGPAHNDLGLVYLQTGRLYDAAWEFENAARLMSHQPEPRSNLGMVYEQSMQLDKAIDAYAQAEELAPQNPQYIGNLARARVRAGLKDEQTRKLLQELLMRDSRPDWLDWARTQLLSVRGTLDRQSINPMTSPAQ
jgi:Flp pilus assembly protein TadD